MAKKTVTTQYYYVYEEKVTTRDGKDQVERTHINLPSCILDALGEEDKSISLASHRNTVIDPGRIQIMQQEKSDETDKQGLYELQILRLREKIQPEIANKDGGLEIFELEDGKFIAESASALFDPLTNILVLQNNYFGVNIGFLKAYLNVLLRKPEDKSLIGFEPLIEGKINIGKINRVIRSFSVKCSFEGEPHDMHKHAEGFRCYRPAQLKYTVSAKERSHKSLDPVETLKELELLHQDPMVTSLKVTIEDHEQHASTIDLLNDRMMDHFFVHSATSKSPIRHSQIYPELKKAYLTRTTEIGDERFAARKKK